MTTFPLELAKELKDAGWPQVTHHLQRDWDAADKPVYPSLSELIEACPKTNAWGFDVDLAIRWHDFYKKWVAGYLDEFEPHVCGEDGETPEIAVARLWIKHFSPKALEKEEREDAADHSRT